MNQWTCIKLYKITEFESLVKTILIRYRLAITLLVLYYG